MKILGLLPLVHGLWCWDGSSTKMQAVECSGSCRLVSQNCSDNGSIAVASCSNSTCSTGANCGLCCETDYCNSKDSSNVELEEVTVGGLPMNSMRLTGISGRNVARNLCATLVLVEPESTSCISQAGSSYLVVKKGRHCAWDDSGVNVTALTGCWKDLMGSRPDVSLNVTTNSSIFSGTFRFKSARKQTHPPMPPFLKPQFFKPHLTKPLMRPSKAMRPPKRGRDSPTKRTRFAIANNNTADKVSIASATKDSFIVNISSPSGIGGTTITKINGAWPKTKQVLLNLRGLEDFQVSNGNLTLHASVKTDSVRVWADESRMKSIPRMFIDVVADGAVVPSFQLPLTEGMQFRVTLPKLLFVPNVTALHISWIDFYRG